MTDIERQPQFCAVLMAGGKSSRMGCDKRLLEMDGKPLWLRQIQLLESLCLNELVVSGPVDGPWAKTHVSIPDCQPSGGPIIGIYSTLQSIRSPLALILAVDMPRMSATYLRSLLGGSSNECGIVPVRDGAFEPLAGVYPRECAMIAKTLIDSGNFALQHFVQQCVEAGMLSPKEVSPSEEACFANINSPEDFQELRQK